MGQIQVKGIRCYAYHGLNDYEKRKGQPFIVSFTLQTDFARVMVSDKVEDTVNYSTASKLVVKTVRENCFNMIERLAGEIADVLLREFAPVCRVSVTVEKPRAPIAADFESVSVTVEKERGTDA